MFTFIPLFQSVIQALWRSRDRDESFLAQSADLCDLERRIRTLDERGRDPGNGIALGLYAR